MLIDSHCHLNLAAFHADFADCLARMKAANVAYALCAGVDMKTYPELLHLANTYPEIFISVGLHPEINDEAEILEEALVAHAQNPKVLAIGETGLDYYWHKDAPEWQRARFRTHIRAAKKAKKPLIIHNRDATDDVFRILESENAGEVGGVFHCFTETAAWAQRAVAMGFYVSFSGIVTFKNAKIVHEAAQSVPLDRLLIETDAPYLSPEPHRGKRAEPAFVAHVADKLAALRGQSVETIAQATSDNFIRLFKPTFTPALSPCTFPPASSPCA